MGFYKFLQNDLKTKLITQITVKLERLGKKKEGLEIVSETTGRAKNSKNGASLKDSKKEQEEGFDSAEKKKEVSKLLIEIEAEQVKLIAELERVKTRKLTLDKVVAHGLIIARKYEDHQLESSLNLLMQEMLKETIRRQRNPRDEMTTSMNAEWQAMFMENLKWSLEYFYKPKQLLADRTKTMAEKKINELLERCKAQGDMPPPQNTLSSASSPNKEYLYNCFNGTLHSAQPTVVVTTDGIWPDTLPRNESTSLLRSASLLTMEKPPDMIPLSRKELKNLETTLKQTYRNYLMPYLLEPGGTASFPLLLDDHMLDSDLDPEIKQLQNVYVDLETVKQREVENEKRELSMGVLAANSITGKMENAISITTNKTDPFSVPHLNDFRHLQEVTDVKEMSSTSDRSSNTYDIIHNKDRSILRWIKDSKILRRMGLTIEGDHPRREDGRMVTENITTTAATTVLPTTVTTVTFSTTSIRTLYHNIEPFQHPDDFWIVRESVMVNFDGKRSIKNEHQLFLESRNLTWDDLQWNIDTGMTNILYNHIPNDQEVKAINHVEKAVNESESAAMALKEILQGRNTIVASITSSITPETTSTTALSRTSKPKPRPRLLKTFIRWCKESLIGKSLPIKYSLLNDKLFNKVMIIDDFYGIRTGLDVPMSKLYYARIGEHQVWDPNSAGSRVMEYLSAETDFYELTEKKSVTESKAIKPGTESNSAIESKSSDDDKILKTMTQKTTSQSVPGNVENVKKKVFRNYMGDVKDKNLGIFELVPGEKDPLASAGFSAPPYEMPIAAGASGSAASDVAAFNSLSLVIKNEAQKLDRVERSLRHRMVLEKDTNERFWKSSSKIADVVTDSSSSSHTHIESSSSLQARRNESVPKIPLSQVTNEVHINKLEDCEPRSYEDLVEEEKAIKGAVGNSINPHPSFAPKYPDRHYPKYATEIILPAARWIIKKSAASGVHSFHDLRTNGKTEKPEYREIDVERQESKNSSYSLDENRNLKLLQTTSWTLSEKLVDSSIYSNEALGDPTSGDPTSKAKIPGKSKKIRKRSLSINSPRSQSLQFRKSIFSASWDMMNHPDDYWYTPFQYLDNWRNYSATMFKSDFVSELGDHELEGRLKSLYSIQSPVESVANSAVTNSVVTSSSSSDNSNVSASAPALTEADKSLLEEISSHQYRFTYGRDQILEGWLNIKGRPSKYSIPDPKQTHNWRSFPFNNFFRENQMLKMMIITRLHWTRDVYLPDECGGANVFHVNPENFQRLHTKCEEKFALCGNWRMRLPDNSIAAKHGLNLKCPDECYGIPTEDTILPDGTIKKNIIVTNAQGCPTQHPRGYMPMINNQQTAMQMWVDTFTDIYGSVMMEFWYLRAKPSFYAESFIADQFNDQRKQECLNQGQNHLGMSEPGNKEREEANRLLLQESEKKKNEQKNAVSTSSSNTATVATETETNSESSNGETNSEENESTPVPTAVDLFAQSVYGYCSDIYGDLPAVKMTPWDLKFHVVNGRAITAKLYIPIENGASDKNKKLHNNMQFFINFEYEDEDDDSSSTGSSSGTSISPSSKKSRTPEKKDFRRKRKWKFLPADEGGTVDLPYHTGDRTLFDQLAIAGRKPVNLNDAVEFAERVSKKFRLPYLRVDFFLIREVAIMRGKTREDIRGGIDSADGIANTADDIAGGIGVNANEPSFDPLIPTLQRIPYDRLYFTEFTVAPDGCNLRWSRDLFEMAFEKGVFWKNRKKRRY